MSASTRREIDWSTATVEGGRLTVLLRGERPRGWRRSFEAVARLLEVPGGRWGRVAARGDSISVARVQPGAESELRQFLEGVVLQVNADLDLVAAAGEEDPAASSDRAMAATFRSFAGG